MNRTELEGLKRAELQKLAKANGIKANAKNEQLIEELLTKLQDNAIDDQVKEEPAADNKPAAVSQEDTEKPPKKSSKKVGMKPRKEPRGKKEKTVEKPPIVDVAQKEEETADELDNAGKQTAEATEAADHTGQDGQQDTPAPSITKPAVDTGAATEETVESRTPAGIDANEDVSISHDPEEMEPFPTQLPPYASQAPPPQTPRGASDEAGVSLTLAMFDRFEEAAKAIEILRTEFEEHKNWASQTIDALNEELAAQARIIEDSETKIKLLQERLDKKDENHEVHVNSVKEREDSNTPAKASPSPKDSMVINPSFWPVPAASPFSLPPAPRPAPRVLPSREQILGKRARDSEASTADMSFFGKGHANGSLILKPQKKRPRRDESDEYHSGSGSESEGEHEHDRSLLSDADREVIKKVPTALPSDTASAGRPVWGSNPFSAASSTVAPEASTSEPESAVPSAVETTSLKAGPPPTFTVNGTTNADKSEPSSSTQPRSLVPPSAFSFAGLENFKPGPSTSKTSYASAHRDQPPIAALPFGSLLSSSFALSSASTAATARPAGEAPMFSFQPLASDSEEGPVSERTKEVRRRLEEYMATHGDRRRESTGGRVGSGRKHSLATPYSRPDSRK